MPNSSGDPKWVNGAKCSSDNFAGLVGELGERMWVADMAKEGKREAARVYFMAGKKLDKLVRIWDEEAREEEQIGEGKGGNYSVCAKAVQGFVEKAVAFCSAVGLSPARMYGEWLACPMRVIRPTEEYNWAQRKLGHVPLGW